MNRTIPKAYFLEQMGMWVEFKNKMELSKEGKGKLEVGIWAWVKGRLPRAGRGKPGLTSGILGIPQQMEEKHHSQIVPMNWFCRHISLSIQFPHMEIWRFGSMEIIILVA